MKWGGKLVGGAFGALAGGPVGAILGLIAGHLVDDKLEGDAGAREALRRRPLHRVEDAAVAEDESDDEGEAVGDPKAVNALFFQVTFEVMGHVAKADGRVSDEDIRAARSVMTEFRLREVQIAAAIAHFTAGKDPGYDLSRAVMALRRVCAGRPDLLRNFLEIQLRTALAANDLGFVLSAQLPVALDAYLLRELLAPERAAGLEVGEFSVVHLSATNPSSGIIAIETHAPKS